MPRRPPETFHSDLHLARWRRVLIWLGESPVGRTIFGFSLAAVLAVPAFLMGITWFGWLAVFVVGFVSGYKVARSYWQSGDDIPKL